MATAMSGLTDHVPIFAWVSCILGVLYYSFRSYAVYRARSQIISQHGCKAPSKYPVWDPFFGLDVVYDAIRAIKRKTFLSEKLSHYETYGMTHSSRLTTFPAISTIQPENIKAVLSTHFKDFVVGSPRRRAFGPVIANSILVADGVEWEHSRAFLKPSFSRSQVGDLATLEYHVKNLIEAIPRDGSTVDLAELFLRFTADVTTDFMFGESILSQPHPDAFGGDLTKACRDAQLGAERRFRLGIFANLVPQPAFYKSVKKVHAYMEAHVDKAIKQRRLSKETKQESTKSDGRYIFLNELAKLTDDKLVLRDQLLGVFVAGRDTTAALLSNLFFVLARNAEAYKKLHDEISSLSGQKPTLDDLKGLKYLTWCLNESQYHDSNMIRSHANLAASTALRLYPVVQGTSRISLKDLVLPEGGGEDGKSPILVTKGTLVIFHMSAMHKHPDLWGFDAEEFRPERWQDEKASWVRLLKSFQI